MAGEMSTQTPSADGWAASTLGELLGSEARAKVLGCLLGGAPGPLHLREIARRCGVPYTAARREVGRLEGFGILRSELIGRSKRFHLVEGSPLLPGLRELVRRTVGLLPELQRKLADEAVEVAFVFGSLARGQDTGESDVDLLVVGDMDPVRLSRLCAELEGELGREVNLVSFGAEEFRERMRIPSSFLSSVLRQPRIFLRGDDYALRRLDARISSQPE